MGFFKKFPNNKSPSLCPFTNFSFLIQKTPKHRRLLKNNSRKSYRGATLIRPVGDRLQRGEQFFKPYFQLQIMTEVLSFFAQNLSLGDPEGPPVSKIGSAPGQFWTLVTTAKYPFKGT